MSSVLDSNDTKNFDNTFDSLSIGQWDKLTILLVIFIKLIICLVWYRLKASNDFKHTT